MDSLDLWRRVIAPTPSRADADAVLLQVLAWVGESATPDRVFTPAQLEAWALGAGFEKRDTAELVVLLRRVWPLVPSPSELSTEINDAIAARRYA